jgi:uncharacterized membrane protein YdjX (TVP38/TMEM64 family)
MEWLSPVVQQLEGLGRWGPVLFIVIYILAAITLAPAFLLTFSAGAVFGLWRGTLLTYVGAVLGASAVYALAAPLARSRLLRWIDRDPRVAATRRAVARDSAWIMFLLRLSPLVPYNLLNYALSLSGVGYREYLLSSVGMIPAIVMYAYYGKVVGDVTRIAAGVSPPRGGEYYVMLIVGLIATFAATSLITRAAKKAMAEGLVVQK